MDLSLFCMPLTLLTLENAEQEPWHHDHRFVRMSGRLIECPIPNDGSLCKYYEDNVLIEQKLILQFSQVLRYICLFIVGEPSLGHTDARCVESRTRGKQPSLRDSSSSHSFDDIQVGTPIHYCLEEGIAFCMWRCRTMIESWRRSRDGPIAANRVKPS